MVESSSRSHIVDTQADNTYSLGPQIHIRVVEDKGRGHYIQDFLAISDGEDGEGVMKKLRTMHRKDTGWALRFVRRCRDSFTMRREAVMLANISPVGGSPSFLAFLSRASSSNR